MIRQFRYTCVQAIKQMVRNKAMTFASILAITAMLMILGVFFVIIVNVNEGITSIKQDYDNIEVFYLDSTKAQVIEKTKKDVGKWANVKAVNYRSKEEAMRILKKSWGENGYLLDSIKDNPLPRSLVITVSNVEKADDIAAKAKKLNGIEDIKYYKDTVDKLIKFTNGIKVAAGIIMAFLVLVSIVVVSNTIKLTVLNRSEEIAIMKYVGAGNGFIRGPFLIEGILIGAFSALISAGLVTFIYSKVISRLGAGVTEILSVPMVKAGNMSPYIICMFLAIGIIIGAWGSMISMKKFLDI